MAEADFMTAVSEIVTTVVDSCAEAVSEISVTTIVEVFVTVPSDTVSEEDSSGLSVVARANRQIAFR